MKNLQARNREILSQMESAQGEEFNALEREFKVNLNKIEMETAEKNAASAPVREVSKNEQLKKYVRENRGRISEISLSRETAPYSITSSVVTTDDKNNMTSAGLPVTINDVVNPLEMDLVYDKLGIKVATGVHGTLIWPCLDTAAEVTVAGEAVTLADTDINFSKITAVPQRVGIKVNVSNEALNDAAFDLYGLVTNQIAASLGRALNKAVIGGTAVGSLVGPFAGTNAKRGSVTFASTYPTYAELLQMKGIVAGKGVQMTGFCYIMSATTYATLEATPITTGDSRMIIEGGKIAGYPVFVTESAKVADGTVYAGALAYCALNQHEEPRLVVDPVTMADSNITRFIFNAQWSLTVLKHEAFCIGKKA